MRSHRTPNETVERARWGACAVLVLALAMPAVAGAQDGNYDELISQGLSEFQIGNWQEAYALFKQAHAIDQNARTSRGLGMTAYNLRDYPAAIEHLQAALASERKALDASMRQDAEELLAKARRLAGEIRVTLEPPSATLYADGEAREEHTFLLGTGRSTLRAELEGHAPVERVIEVEGGQVHEVHLVLQPVAGAPPPSAAAAAAATQPGPTPATSAPAAKRDSNSSGTWLWVTISTAVAAALIVGGALAVSSSDDGDASTPVPEGNVGDVIYASRVR